MKYLIDANVLCEPSKRLCTQRVLDWMDLNELEIVTSSVVFGEVWRGIDALPSGKKRAELETWFDQVRERIPALPFDKEVALVWAELANHVKASGFTVGIMDTLIAATARCHGLTVATRNVDDFTRCGVAVVNPFD